MYTEIACGPVIGELSGQDDEEAWPLTKVTVILEPSFLPLYVDELLGRKSSAPETRVFPLSTLTEDVVAVQIVPEQVVQSGLGESPRL
jgi:hypothetical protein